MGLILNVYLHALFKTASFYVSVKHHKYSVRDFKIFTVHSTFYGHSQIRKRFLIEITLFSHSRSLKLLATFSIAITPGHGRLSVILSHGVNLIERELPRLWASLILT